MEKIVFDVLDRYSYNDMKELRLSIDKYIEYKINKDIQENNELELCIVPLINYGNIYLNESNLIIKLYNKFPKLIISECDDRRYIYIQCNIANMKNQELAEMLLANDYHDNDILICQIPKYLNTYEDIIKYRHLYKKVKYDYLSEKIDMKTY
jgi:hypothetical protein